MIIIAEPQCVGFEHVEFNSALIIAIKNALKDENILFIAEKKHLNYVRNIVDSYSMDIEYKQIIIPMRSQSDFLRFPSEYRTIHNIFRTAKELKSSKIIFSSVSSSSIISIKIMIRLFQNVKVLTVLHGILNSLKSVPKIPTELIFWINIWLRFFNSRRLKFLVLGKYIESELIREIPISLCTESIDMPVIFKSNQIHYLPINKKIKFGYLGVIHNLKGIDLFLNLSNDIYKLKSNKNAKFIVIGHITDGRTDKFPKSVFVPSPNIPLTNEEYENYIKKTNYLIFPYNEHYTKLRASATLFDAFSYLKPIIALKTPYFEYFFDKMGDIGYLCEDYDEMLEIIIKIVDNMPNRQYIRQQQNILDARSEFSLDNVSKKFRNILDDF